MQIRVNSIHPTVVKTDMGRFWVDDKERGDRFKEHAPEERFAGMDPTVYFVTARQQYGCMSYDPLPYILIVGRKRPFQHPIHNSFFLMLMLLSGDIHVNPGPINGNPTSLCSPLPNNNFAAAATPPNTPPSAATAAVDSDPPSPPPAPPAPPHHHHNDSTNNKNLNSAH